MLHGSSVAIYLEGILFPCLSFKLELIPDVEPLVATLEDHRGRTFLCFLERIDQDRLYFKLAAFAVALERLHLDNPDYDLAS
jgi:hypothetical protein